MDLTNGDGIDVAIDYVSSTATLEAGAKALGKRGRLVTLGGAGETFQANAFDLLVNEQSLLGSRYVTRLEVLETLDLAARREIWPIVTDIRPMAEAEALHEAVERGEIIGRAALRIG
jgi:D-arabinose 1-dehydrogenase-like Zn-dependent alcohol dehydrogenase